MGCDFFGFLALLMGLPLGLLLCLGQNVDKTNGFSYISMAMGQEQAQEQAPVQGLNSQKTKIPNPQNPRIQRLGV